MLRHVPSPRASLLGLGLALVAGAGCSSRSEPRGPTGRVEVSVAPLTLGTISGACYHIIVENGAGETVFAVHDVCSDQYGDGAGAVSYVGPCDAQAPNQTNRVTLELVSLTAGTPPAPLDGDDFVNPCPVGQDRCRLEAECQPNADVLVPFELVVMRSAEQGFFDVAVTFDDIFCSAKLDCLGEGLLHDPVSGERGPTVVLTGACTAGAGQDTVLHMADVVITCDDDPDVRPDPAGAPDPGLPPIDIAVLDPTGGPGQLYTAPDATPAAPSPHPFIFQVATYRGDEELPSLPDIDKCYWNLAIGVVPGLTSASVPGGVPADRPYCAIHTRMTATDGMSLVGGSTSAGSNYPYIDYWVDLTDATGALTCGANPLDGAGSGVTSSYTTFGAPQEFCYYLDCDGGPVGDQCEVVTTCPTAPGEVELTQRAERITVTSPSGNASGTFTLPASAGVATVVDCCADDCCQAPE